MTARHATPLLAIETEEAGSARSSTLRDRSGIAIEELILDIRPSDAFRGATAVNIEVWTGPALVVGVIHLTLTPTQWRALAAFAHARAEEGEAGI